MIPFLFVAEIEYQNREELAEPTEADIQEIQDAAKKAKEKKKDIAGKRSTSTTIIKYIGVGFVTNCYWGYVFCQMLGPVKRNNCMHSLTLFGKVVYEAQLFENAPKLCFN